MKTTELERTNLEAHVDLCAQRYHSLETRLDKLETKVDQLSTSIDNRFEKIENTLERISQQMDTYQRSSLKTYLGWAGAIIAILLATVGWTLTELMLK